jgi:AraC-like DNA-binding protein
MFYPSVGLIQQIADELELKHGGVPHFPVPVLTDDHTAGLIRNLHLVLDRATSRLERDVHLGQAFGALLLGHHRDRLLPDRLTDRRPVNFARDYLEAHYSENIALETLATVAGVSPFHLSRLFRAQTGLPPHAYLVHVRVRQAKRLLAQGESISQAALVTGFTDQSHLTRWFKRIMGVTPGQYAP